jgi:hypothetical protein
VLVIFEVGRVDRAGRGGRVGRDEPTEFPARCNAPHKEILSLFVSEASTDRAPGEKGPCVFVDADTRRIGMTASKKLAIRTKLASCSVEAANYARCVTGLVEVEKHSCQKEFELLKACFKRAR